MAGWVVGPIMEKIINACSDYLQDQYLRWQRGVKKELERLRENHPKVQAVVSAYTRAQITGCNPTALNRWIWQLRDAIDEADDVLDDFQCMNLEEEDIKNEKQQKFVKKIVKIALRMDPNLKRLETVVKKLYKVSAEAITFLHLIENATQEQQELQLCKDRKTGCLPQNDLIGRDKEKDYIVQWLRNVDPLRNEDPAPPTLCGNFSLLSIVGVGGIGKTALVQHIYKYLKDEFELKIWVSVSNDSEATMVISDMLECLQNEMPRSETLAALQVRLKDVVQSKRFLLVLDDICEEDCNNWENVLAPLAYGSFGSKILLTTQMDSVAAMISNEIGQKKEILKLNGLEEDVCLKLLNTHAFANVENLGAHPKLTNIASSMVKKLSGSPLALKIIGGVLNSNLSENFWMNILNTVVLNIETEPCRNNILPILRLSFTFLPQPLQNCFAFCGIFPQHHPFDKDDLVRMWIALGFIQESPIEGETLEDIGKRYFDVLVRNSFFDEFQDNTRIYYKMHDLLHDLAQSISSKECFTFVGDADLSFKTPKTIRHLFVKTTNPKVLRMIKDVKNLHSLFFTIGRGVQDLTEILAEFFKASKSIRLLFIASPYLDEPLLLEEMSEAIKYLRHLRYLKFGGCYAQIPRSLGSLNHMHFISYSNVVGDRVILVWDVNMAPDIVSVSSTHPRLPGRITP